MKRKRGIARKGRGGRGRGKKTVQEMGLSTGDENAFSPPKDPDAALKHALPTELRTYKLRGKRKIGSSSHHVNLIDEEIDDVLETENALCCVTEGEKVREEPASKSQLQVSKVPSPLNESTSKSKICKDMQLSIPRDQSEDPMAAAISCHVKQKRVPTCSGTINLTEIAMADDEDGVESSFGPASVDVKGYRVRPETAPILHQILEQQGDIAKDCKLAKVLHGCLLENVCHVYEKLQISTCNEIQTSELSEMQATIKGLENLGFNLQWLSKKVDEILEVKLFLNRFAKKRKELKKASDQLATLRRTMAPIQQRQCDLEEELKKMKTKSAIQKVRNLYRNPLI